MKKFAECDTWEIAKFIGKHQKLFDFIGIFEYNEITKRYLYAGTI